MPKEFKEAYVTNIVKAAKSVTEYLHRNRFEIVISAGSSGQWPSFMIRTWWKKLYPKTKPPKFVALGTLDLTRKLSAEEVKALLEKRLVGIKYSRSPVLILDGFAVTGETLQKVRAALQSLKCQEIKTAVITSKKYQQYKVSPDYVGGVFVDDVFLWRERRDAIDRALVNRSGEMSRKIADYQSASMQYLKGARKHIRDSINHTRRK